MPGALRWDSASCSSAHQSARLQSCGRVEAVVESEPFLVVLLTRSSCRWVGMSWRLERPGLRRGGRGGYVALRVLGRSEGLEQCPVRFAGVEQGSDAVVVEVGESEGGAFDAFDQVVDGYL